MKRIIKREGLPKVVQVVAPSSKDPVRQIGTQPRSLAGAFGQRRLVRRALRAAKGSPA